MTIHAIYGAISPYFRRRRLRNFERLMRPTRSDSILDVGGTEAFWRGSAFKPQVTLLNTDKSLFGSEEPGWSRIVGDGCALNFPDQSFDIVFSNSAIEHVGTWERQVLFAAESLRVGRAIWIQTPAREYFIEPHLIGVFIHWLPRSWQRHLIRWLTVRGLIERLDHATIEAFLNEVRLLSLEEMKDLFPGCQILRERFLGMSKCYVAIKNADASAGTARTS